MRMRAIPKLDLPAGKIVEFRPGGYHLMLTGLKRPLSKGDVVQIQLKIEASDKSVKTVEVRAEVRELRTGETESIIEGASAAPRAKPERRS